MRAFVALYPPPEVIESLSIFLQPRQEAQSPLRWAPPDQWHITLAFAPELPETALDEVITRLGKAARKRYPMEFQLGGAGVFPDVYDARVLYIKPALASEVSEELHRLANGARRALARAGVRVEGGRFRPHLTVARSGRPFEATRWIRVLSTWRSTEWIASEFALVASRLGAGPGGLPEHRRIARIGIG